MNLLSQFTSTSLSGMETALWGLGVTLALTIFYYLARRGSHELDGTARLFFVGLLSLVLAVALSALVREGMLRASDEYFFSLALEWRSESVLSVLNTLTDTTDTLWFGIVTIFIALLFTLLKLRDQAAFLIAALGIGVVVKDALKSLFHIARPMGNLVEAANWSFPSGHTLLTAIVATSLYLALRERLPSAWLQALLFILCILAVTLVAASRIVLGIHWFSDVVAGALLGFSIVCVGQALLVRGRGGW